MISRIKTVTLGCALGMALTALTGGVAAAKEGVWATKKPSEWTLDEVREISNKSPWVQTVSVFPTVLNAPGVVAKPAATGARVGLFVRWYSSGIIRQATVRGAQLSGGITESQAAQMTRPYDRFYIISVSAPETLGVVDGLPFEQLVNTTKLDVDGTLFPLVQVVRPAQTGSPEALFFFSRGAGIPAEAKKATFSTEMGEAKVEATFTLAKMAVAGKRDLDGETGTLSPDETRRRAVQAAVLAAGDDALSRAITDVQVKSAPPKDKTKKETRWGVYVFYDPNRELNNPAEARAVDLVARKQMMSANVGKWSAGLKGETLDAIIFVDPTKNEAVDYILGVDAEKVAKLEGEAAAKLFKEKLQKADAKKPSN